MLIIKDKIGNYYHIQFVRSPELYGEERFQKYCWVSVQSFYSIDSIWNERLKNIIRQRFPKAKYRYTIFGNAEIKFTNKADEAAFILLADSDVEVND